MPRTTRNRPHRSGSSQVGITPDRQSAFLDALAACGSVTRAARAVGLSRTAVYNLRNRQDPGAEAFRVAWDGALKQAVAVLAETAFERALNGVEEPVFHKGEQVGTRTRHNDKLLMFLLRTLDPDTYAPIREKPAASDALPSRPRPTQGSGSTPSTPSTLSTLSTSSPALLLRDDDDIDDAAFSAQLHALRHAPEPQVTSKRNARRLAGRQKRAGRA